MLLILITTVVTKALGESKKKNETSLNLLPISSEALVAFYRLDGNAQDESGNELHGIETNIKWVEGRDDTPQSAAHFDGLVSNIQVEGIEFSERSFSVSIWCKRDLGNHVATDVLLGQSEMNFGFQWGGQNMIFGFTWYGTDLYLPSSGFENYDLGTWHHYVGTYDADSWVRRIFRDGKPMSQDIAPNFKSKGTLYIGTSHLGGNRAFPGAIDEVILFNRALREAEILSLFHGKFAIIDNGHNDTGMPDPLDGNIREDEFTNQSDTNDPDGDGLSDEWEILLGTDPFEVLLPTTVKNPQIRLRTLLHLKRLDIDQTKNRSIVHHPNDESNMSQSRLPQP